MKNRFLIIVFVSFFLLSHPALKASISCLENWYIAASPSIVWHNGHQFCSRTLHKKLEFDRHYKIGWGGNASIGYLIEGQHCLNFRAETELVYRENKLEKINLAVRNDNKNISEHYSSIGRNRDLAVMINLLMDVPIPAYTYWNLYVGVGLGISKNRLEGRKFGPLPERSPFASHAWLAARQLLGGLSYKLASCLTLTLGYRLFATEKVKTARYETISANTPYAQSVDLGLRLQL